MKKSTPKKVIKKKVPAFKTKPLDMSSLHTNDDVKRYIGFVTENFQGQVSAVAEQFLGLNEKVDGIIELQQSHSEMLQAHSEMLQAHSEMLGKLMVSNEEIKAGLMQKADREEMGRLGMRVATLESIVYSGKERKPKA